MMPASAIPMAHPKSVEAWEDKLPESTDSESDSLDGDSTSGATITAGAVVGLAVSFIDTSRFDIIET